ncbi:nuclear pore complex protein NUP1-like isoform X1 [Musa acuminata AAA Group]|uniref:nuclear pore complex protein NUP1-like isoform X1 n=1 Tax=Musa acuminata AAA Group TaxID=214697 RepID=UPI0031D7D567
MATSGYDGRIGGKLRRRPFRRAAATPYDRPPSAARGLTTTVPEPGGDGWLAKLVDPASRFISSSASRLFSSVFRKRLTAPPADETPGENLQSREIAEASSDEMSADLQENKADSGNNATNNFDSNMFLEFEQLLEHKTFTRAQFEHLMEILRSRTMDSDMSKPAVDNDKVDETTVPLPEKEIESSIPHEDRRTPPDTLAIPDASPVELAKAYMGSRVSTVPPLALSWRSHLFHEYKKVPTSLTSATKPFDLKGPRSVRFSGSTVIPESGYLTPRSSGRSTMYRMTCSPYIKGERSSKDDSVGSLSHRTPESTRQLGGRQVFKRRSLVLESDLGPFLPIRSIRQKLTVKPSSKVMHSVLPGNLHHSPSTPFKRDVQDDLSVIQKPIWSDGHEKSGDNRISNNIVTTVSPQSSEMEKKILQQLDKLVPSPKEKTSKLKSNTLDESPDNVMHASSGQTLRNEEMYSTKSKFVQGNNLDSFRGSLMPDFRNSLSYKQETATFPQENCSSVSISGVKLMSEANDMCDGVISVTAAMCDKAAAEAMISDSVVVSQHQKLAFQSAALKDTQDVSNTYTSMDASCPLKDKDEMKITDKAVRPSIIRTNFSSSMTSTSLSSSSSDFSKAAHLKLSVDSIAESGKGFTFPFATAPSTSQIPPTPTMPSSLVKKSAMQKGQIDAPLFSFGSKDSNRADFSSTTTMRSFSATSGPGNDISNATASAMVKDSDADKHEGQISINLSKSVGVDNSADESTSNIPVVYSFGSSHSEFMPNGSLNLPSASSAVSVMAYSGSTGSMIFSTVTAVSASSFSTFVSSESPPLSTVPSLQFGSTALLVSPTSVSQPLDKSTATDFEGMHSKVPPFNTNTANPGTSANFMFGGSFSSATNTGSILATSTVSRIGSSFIAPAASTLFSVSAGSQSALAPASTFSGASNSTFKFASAQSNDSSPSVVDNNTRGVAGSVGTQSTQGGSGISQISESSSSLFGPFCSSPTFGLNVLSSSSLGSSQFGAATTGFDLLSSSYLFSSSVGANSSCLSATSSSALAPAPSLFGSTFQSSISSAFGTSFGSNASYSSTGLAFGVSGSGGSPFVFSSLSAPAFSTNSAGGSSSSNLYGQPVFGSSSPATAFSSGTPRNDQMNVVDSMVEDSAKSAGSLVPQFGQPSTSSSITVFGTPVTQPTSSPFFQFGSHQQPTLPQSSPFQASGSLVEQLPQGGSFSLGSGGGDKSGRKIVKVRRDRLRKK